MGRYAQSENAWGVRILVLGIGVLYLIGGPEPKHAASRMDSPALRALTQLCSALTTAGGTFVQESQSPTTRRKRQEQGWFAWKRPDHLWWEYTQPEHKVLLWTPERFEFYVETDCTVYTESDPQRTLQQHPLIGFIRDCTLQEWLPRLQTFRVRDAVQEWVFTTPETASDRIPWTRLRIRWNRARRQLVVETTDWLYHSIRYVLRFRDDLVGRADAELVWETRFPPDCERIPLAEIQ